MLLKGAVTLFSAFKKQPRSLGFFHDGGIYVLPLEVSAFLEKIVAVRSELKEQLDETYFNKPIGWELIKTLSFSSWTSS